MADTTIMRRNNLQSILESIDSLGDATTFDLAERTGLSLATISRVTSQLKNKGLILQERKQTSDPGRKPELYRLNDHFGSSVYFNLKSGCLQAYALDFGGTVLQQTQTPVNSTLTVSDLLHEMRRQIGILTSNAQATSPLAVCLTLPGQQSTEDGTIRRIPNFPCLEAVAVGEQIQQALGLPCLIGNTARLTAWGHFLARRKDVSNLIYLEITGDCGIGAGLVLGGRLYEDAVGLAGEVGDMIVRSKDRDATQSRGALEEDAGLMSIVQRARGIMPDATADLSALEKAAAGNEAILALLHDATRDWAAAMINLCAVLSPDKIVIGGAVSDENTLIRNLIDRHLKAMYHRPISLAFAPSGCLCHTQGAGNLLKNFLFGQELDHIDE